MGWGGDAWGDDEYSDVVVASVSNVTFDCTAEDDALGIDRPGVIIFSIGLSGDYLHVEISTGTTISLSLSISGDYPGQSTIDGEIVPFTLTISGDSAVGVGGGNAWVWTSNIGEMNFDLDRTGEPSRRPMSYGGNVYQIRKLGNSAIVYGQMGISKMTPQGVQWAVQDIHPIGIKSKRAATGTDGTSHSVSGTDEVHFFLDRNDILHRLTPEGLPERMDFSQLMSGLGATVAMSYDVRKKTAYITDGSQGYALTEDGLGECPANITDIAWKDGTLYVLAPAAITNTPLEITSDIVDFGVRTEKTIAYIEVGTDVSVDMYVALDYRFKKSDSWSTSDWRRLDDEGRASFMITSTEFRFKVKLITYEDIEIDYINAVGKFIGAEPIEGAAYDN
jgi:hypothetical protein